MTQYGIPEPFDSHFLLLTFAITLFIQLGVWAVSTLLRTEKAFDAAGAVNYVIVAALTFGLSGTWSARQAICTAAVVICRGWLGTFLLIRVIQRKGDSRFEELRKHWWQLLTTFALQAVWVWLCAMPCIVLNGEETQPELSWIDYVGVGVFVFGFGLQLIADLHKWSFRGGCGGDSHRGQFLKAGCWAFSRHPNYFGEILIWWGIWIMSLQAFLDPNELSRLAWLALTLLSPGFTSLLMLCGSGSLMSEKKFDTDYRYTRPDEWSSYLDQVPPMIPSFFFCGSAVYTRLPSAAKCLFCCEFPFYRAKDDDKYKGPKEPLGHERDDASVSIEAIA